MKLGFVDLMFRAWYYLRLGYGTYLWFFVGFVTFLSTTYYLAIERVPFLQEIFSRFHVFVAFMILVIVPAGVFIGWLHMKRTLAFPTEVTIGVEANPYMYIVYPGKEEEVWVPVWLLTIRALQKILEKEKMLSPQEKSEFENMKAKFEKLLRGEAVGVPRQRKLLADWKRERDPIKQKK